MKRRQFITQSVGFLALSQGLSSCGDNPSAFSIRLLKSSIPPQLINRFLLEIPQGKAFKFTPESSLKKLWELLQVWGGQKTTKENFLARFPFFSPPVVPSALMTLGDTWLQKAIASDFIQPLKLSALPNWATLDPVWPKLVTRDRQGLLDPQGQIWGAPYRWGTTMIVYRRDFFRGLGWTPQDWADLWRPEVTQQLALVDQPREVIGLTLKKLGYSYNTPDLNAVPNLAAQLQALQAQVKFYSSQYYLQSLLNRDVAIAVGWSNEILPLLANTPNLQAVIPPSGTSLWADCWVMPKTFSGDLTLLNDWINFGWQPQSANQIALFSKGSSPRLTSLPPQEIVPDVRRNPLINLSSALWSKSEFLQPLPPPVEKQYEMFWRKMRQA
ncbi:MAG: extracellular solute-binding protein [Microcystaceae cyanobacterium]